MQQDPRPRIAALDGIRALSILAVVCFHVVYLVGEVRPQNHLTELLANRATGWLFHGHFGVDVFFVLSGFLICRLLTAERARSGKIHFSRFYLRRALRLFPIYFFLIAVLALVRWQSGLEANRQANWWTHLIYVNNFVPVQDQFMAWAWSLAVEEQFYTLCPLMLSVLLGKKAGRWPLWLIAVPLLIALEPLVIGVIASSEQSTPLMVLHPALDAEGYSRQFDLLYDKPYTRFSGLLLGCLGALLTTSTRLLRWMERTSTNFIFFLTGIALCCAAIWPLDYLNWQAPPSVFYLSTYRIAFCTGVLLLLLAALKPNSWWGNFLSWPAFKPIAKLSYSAYLLHPIVIWGLLNQFYPSSPATLATVALFISFGVLGTFALSVPAYLFIERPFLRLRR